MMIKSIEIRGLLGIRRGKLDDLAPLSLFVGPSGPAALAAAAVLCSGAHRPTAFRALTAHAPAGLEGMEQWFDMGVASVAGVFAPNPISDAPELGATVTMELAAARFHATAIVRTGSTIELVRSSEAGEESPLVPVALFGIFESPRTYSDPYVRTADALFGVDPWSENFWNAPLSPHPWYDDSIAYLRELHPRIVAVESVSCGRGPMNDEEHVVSIVQGSPHETFLLHFAGRDFQCTFPLAACLARVKGGVAAIEAPEAFASPSTFADMAKLAHRAVEDGTQVLVATRSRAFLVAALERFERHLDDVAIVSLRQRDGALDPTVFAGSDVMRRLRERGERALDDIFATDV